MVDSNERCIVITGGTGALGRAVVDAFLSNGDRVVAPWVVESETGTMPAHPKLTLLEADISVPAGADAVVASAGRVDVLINGAGGFGGGEPVHRSEIELWDRLYRMNVRTAVCMSAAVAPGMLEAGHGVILNVASQAAIDCPAGIAAYSASKAGVIALTRSLQAELGGDGVRVNAVLPTTIDTPANRKAMPDADFAVWTPPADIANVMLWLASDVGNTVRGGLIPV